MSRNKFKRLSSEISKLTNLTELDLSENRCRSLKAPLAPYRTTLHHPSAFLQHRFLKESPPSALLRFTNWPKSLNGMPGLQRLYMTANSVTELADMKVTSAPRAHTHHRTHTPPPPPPPRFLQNCQTEAPEQLAQSRDGLSLLIRGNPTSATNAQDIKAGALLKLEELSLDMNQVGVQPAAEGGGSGSDRRWQRWQLAAVLAAASDGGCSGQSCCATVLPLTLAVAAAPQISEVPDDIGKLTGLTEISLSDNDTLSTLPKGLMKCTELGTLEMDGPFPPPHTQPQPLPNPTPPPYGCRGPALTSVLPPSQPGTDIDVASLPADLLGFLKERDVVDLSDDEE